MAFRDYTLRIEQTGTVIPNVTGAKLRIDDTLGHAVLDLGDATLAKLLAAAGIVNADLAALAGFLSADVTGRARMAASYFNAATYADKFSSPAIPSGDLANPQAYDPGRAAMAVLRVASAVKDTETVTIGADVYEVDTHDSSTITAGRIRLNLSGGSTVKSQGTLTMPVQPTATDTVTVGATTYTWVASGATAGQINVGANLAAAQVNFVAAINGTDGINAAHATVSAAAFSGNACVLTALAGGTDGNSIATTETFTAETNVFDAATLGTTTAGVDPTAGEFTTALETAVNASGTESVRATRIGANEILINTAAAAGSTTPVASAATTALAEGLTGANNAWDTAALRGGRVAGVRKIHTQTRVPNAAEVALGNMHFVFPFAPTVLAVLVQVTATPGLSKAWNGAATVTGNRVTIDNGALTDWAETDTVTLIVSD